MTGTNAGSRGFTVMELIVAMSISAITLLSGYELFEALKAVGDRQSEDLATTAAIAHGLGRIREDLLHALPRADAREAIFAGTDAGPELATKTTKILEFYSLCANGGQARPSSVRQMCRVRYELVGSAGAVTLYRSAVPVVGAGRGPGVPERELILDRVRQVTIAFHNGQSWEPSFSSDKRLPGGVELMVTVEGRAWPLSIRLPCGAEEGGG